MDLSRADIRALRSSWTHLANQPRLFDELYNNLNSTSQAKAPIRDAPKFRELLGLCVSCIEETDDVIVAFSKDQPQFCQSVIKYIEPMGSVLITTFKQWLGLASFSQEVESAWVKLYCHVANVILDRSDAASDATSVYSEEAPLQVSKAKSMTHLADSSTLSVNLAANAKYRGFRRPVDEPRGAPLKVKIPNSPSFQRLSHTLDADTPTRSVRRSTSFDPRRLRSGASSIWESDSNVSRASSVRRMAAPQPVTPQPQSLVRRLHQRRSSVYSDTLESVVNIPTFDPRKQDNHSPSSSRRSSGDYTSKYSDDGSHKSSVDEVSSGASTLSLRRSSASSTEEQISPSPDFKSTRLQHVRSPSESSSISYMRPLAQQTGRLGTDRFGKSTSSLTSDFSSASGRASVGFMRSSFVLKKEMEQMGYPEEPSSMAQPPQRLYENKRHSSSDSNLRTGRRRNLPRSRMSDVYEEEPMEFTAPMPPIPATPKMMPISQPKMEMITPKNEKKGLRAKLRSMFGGSSSTSKSASKAQAKGHTRQASISSKPVSMTTQSTRPPSMPGSRHHRTNSVLYAPSEQASFTQPSQVQSYGYKSMHSGGSVRSGYTNGNYSVTDLQSVVSMESTTSGFSFFSRRSRKKGNKYQVKTVPYSVWNRGVPELA